MVLVLLAAPVKRMIGPDYEWSAKGGARSCLNPALANAIDVGEGGKKRSSDYLGNLVSERDGRCGVHKFSSMHA